jgi:hypothetical protein
MYMVEFVPIKRITTNGHYEYMAGRFLIRIRVKYGIRNEIYSFKDNNVDYFPIRCHEGIMEIQGRKVLEVGNERMNNPLPIPLQVHANDC